MYFSYYFRQPLASIHLSLLTDMNSLLYITMNNNANHLALAYMVAKGGLLSIALFSQHFWTAG